MQSNSTIVIPSGNSLRLQVAWTDMNGVAEAPSSARYQVFDRDTGASVSAVVSLSSPAAIMEFTVPSNYLPANALKKRPLVVQVEATFPAADKHTENVDVYVARGFSFA